uniref:Uncharacterized protein n=1 Tax=viral metagenome TaxID=1070528 RepID=A0A6M3JRG0_9ZZZZ
MAYDNYKNPGGYQQKEYSGTTALAPVGQNEISALQKVWPDMDELLIKQFFYKAGNKIGASADLIYYVLDKRFPNKYSLETRRITGKEREEIMSDLKVPKDTLFLAMEAELLIYDNHPYPPRKFTGTGTVTAANIKGNKHPVELCETRAETRAIKKAIGRGFRWEVNEDISANDIMQSQSPSTHDHYFEEEYKRLFKHLQILVKDYNISREQKLEIYSSVAGRKVESSKELSGWEISLAIEKLQNLYARQKHHPYIVPQPRGAQHDSVILDDYGQKEFIPSVERPPEVIEADFEEFPENTELEMYCDQIRDQFKQLEWAEENITGFWTWLGKKKSREIWDETCLNKEELLKTKEYLSARITEKEEAEKKHGQTENTPAA